MSLQPQPAAAAIEMAWMDEQHRKRRCALVGQVKAIPVAVRHSLEGLDDTASRAVVAATESATDQFLRLLSEAGFHDGGYA